MADAGVQLARLTTVQDLLRDFRRFGHRRYLAEHATPVLILLDDAGDDEERPSGTRFAGGADGPTAMERARFGTARIPIDDPEKTRAAAADDTRRLVERPDLRVERQTEAEDDRATSGQHLVFRVVKRAGAPFPDRIGLGRAINTDVSLPIAGASKYHAYFTWSASRDEMFVTDAGSRNGTVVDGKRLTPRRSYPVRDACWIEVGGRRLRFFTAKGLCVLLSSRSR